APNARAYLDTLAPPAQRAAASESAAGTAPNHGTQPQASPSSTGDPAPAPPPKQYSPAISELVMPATLATQVALFLFGLLIVRLLIGKDWARQLALRRPGLRQTAIAFLGLPGLMIVAVAVHALGSLFLPTFHYQKGLNEMFESWPAWFGVLAIGLGPG